MPRRSASLVIALGLLVQAGCAAAAPSIHPAEPRPLVGGTQVAGAGARQIVPRDLLQVTVFEAPELGGGLRVSDAGEVSLPLVGVVRAAGSTPRELEDSLTARLRGTYMHDPRVSVQVTEEAVQPIYVLGEVNQPGAYGTGGDGARTLLRAISQAGGLTASAASSRALVIRTGANAERLEVPVDLEAVLDGQAADVILHVGDVVYVPKNTGRAFTLGVIDALVRVLTFRPGL